MQTIVLGKECVAPNRNVFLLLRFFIKHKSKVSSRVLQCAFISICMVVLINAPQSIHLDWNIVLTMGFWKRRGQIRWHKCIPMSISFINILSNTLLFLFEALICKACNTLQLEMRKKSQMFLKERSAYVYVHIFCRGLQKWKVGVGNTPPAPLFSLFQLPPASVILVQDKPNIHDNPCQSMQRSSPLPPNLDTSHLRAMSMHWFFMVNYAIILEIPLPVGSIFHSWSVVKTAFSFVWTAS